MYNAFSASILFTVLTSSAAAHEGAHGNEEMWRVCEGKQLNNSCSFQNRSCDISRGSCQSMADHLVCVRNQPIERAASVGFVDKPEKVVTQKQKNNRYIWIIGALAFLAGGVLLVIRSKYKVR